MATSAAMNTPKTFAARRVAVQKLSARHPSVFGESRCAAKLTITQTGKMIQLFGHVSCHRQMYTPASPAKAAASAKFSHDGIFVLTFTGRCSRVPQIREVCERSQETVHAQNPVARRERVHRSPAPASLSASFPRAAIAAILPPAFVVPRSGRFPRKARDARDLRNLCGEGFPDHCSQAHFSRRIVHTKGAKLATPILFARNLPAAPSSPNMIAKHNRMFRASCVLPGRERDRWPKRIASLFSAAALAA
jgi:hypothetical protein